LLFIFTPISDGNKIFLFTPTFQERNYGVKQGLDVLSYQPLRVLTVMISHLPDQFD
jgi:CDP-glycerol glycerophosphotransferase (TagB/SpsB family)